jgi:phosphatidylserine/phosphatidylglycerophosphate/cardiolipin synthase-like enzyme
MAHRSRRVAPPSWTTLIIVLSVLVLVWLLESGALGGLLRAPSSAAVEAPEQQDGARPGAASTPLPVVPQPSTGNAGMPTAPASVETAALRGYRGPWYQVYFTKPAYPEGPSNRQGGMDEALVADIARAQQRVELASFDLDLATVAAALMDAHERGVHVRVSIDGENLETPEVSSVMGEMAAAGIGVFYDQRNAFMHDKIVVIDGSVVWTGSWNVTINDTFRNNNNMVRIADQALAANYSAKLDAIFNEQGGPGQPSVVRYPDITLGDARVSTMFAPEDPITDVIMAQLAAAHERIDVMAFAFTSDPIADALVEARQRGVAVRVVMENRNSKGTGSAFDHLRDAGIDTHADGNCYIMHHKAMMIDGRKLITGSFNFTASAQNQNDENVLVIDDPSMVALYEAEFERIYDQALQPPRCEN